MSQQNMPAWLAWDNNNIAEAEETLSVNQYRYGVRDIQVRDKEYAEASIYVTKPFDVDGNIMELSLVADEEHVAPIVTGAGTAAWQTAIEYSVCFTDTPAEEDWIPILPQDQKTVEHELLFFAGGKAHLRFRRDINVPMSVYKNGVRLETSDWTYDASNAVTIVSQYDLSAKYSVSYTPDWATQSPWDISIPQSARQASRYIGIDAKEGEVFNSGTDRNGSIQLSKYPYIDYSRINQEDPTYVPIEVVLENANLAGPVKGTTITRVSASTTPIRTKNMTNYRTGVESVLTAYDPTPGTNKQPIQPLIQFKHEGRSLSFLETFHNSDLSLNAGINHGDATIRVIYDYVKTACRLRIILRNTTLDKICTPRLSKYTLIFRAMR